MNQANKQAVRVALITGAARRIGAAIAKHLHQAGFKVVIHCHHSLAEAQRLAQSLNQQRPDSAHVLQQDLCVPKVAKQLIAAALAFAGRLDLLVNNASIFTKTNFAEFNQQNWDNLFATNVRAPFELSLAARPYLAAQQGQIINISDIHSETPLKDYAEYCQTKAALTMQTKALAREFAPEVRVNAVAPGAIAWPENDNALNKQIQEKIIAQTPLKRHGEPQFIAQAVLALVENVFITGQVLRVDGGRSI
ncbi:3-oxoacyl-[acyl-carrier-protein] reductase FabG [Legionella massiliensis]|uniref:3-oxoacyl-[acyl-carrier-protein] reductase FabG n=1 Tax=Legionella massiliensis TaxID=1034943 RepID=A0A078KSH2_9GAMM|nr:pteridine reductase [Legionella massiliensis]CDZ76011.1 3-oxoacyl-[acyl-carrier-protein] reductase FabG [Legionella massiliensis]CEE11749.1 3-oxoacyl-[acyl-carrier-protein] reductase FabG [Legionella massiliensis]